MAIRAEDGRGPQTALREAVAAHFGAASMYDVAVGLHTGQIGWDALLGLVPVLFEVAAAGDEVALGPRCAGWPRGLRDGARPRCAALASATSRCRWCSAAGC